MQECVYKKESMRYFSKIAIMIAGLLLFSCSSEEKEHLNILGLTLDMTLAELHAQIEPYNKSFDASFATKITEITQPRKVEKYNEIFSHLTDIYISYLTDFLNNDDDIITAFTIGKGENAKPISINRMMLLRYDNEKYFHDDDTVEYMEKNFTERFGEPSYKEVSENTSGILMWTASKHKGITKCGNFKILNSINDNSSLEDKTSTHRSLEQSIVDDGCEYVLKFSFFESEGKDVRYVNTELENLAARYDPNIAKKMMESSKERPKL